MQQPSAESHLPVSHVTIAAAMKADAPYASSGCSLPGWHCKQLQTQLNKLPGSGYTVNDHQDGQDDRRSSPAERTCDLYQGAQGLPLPSMAPPAVPDTRLSNQQLRWRAHTACYMLQHHVEDLSRLWLSTFPTMPKPFKLSTLDATLSNQAQTQSTKTGRQCLEHPESCCCLTIQLISRR